MIAGRYEIFDDGPCIRIVSPDSTISTIVGRPVGYHIDDAVIGAIRQQARDIKLLTQMLHDQRLVIDDLEHRRVKVCDENDQPRTDLAAAVAERDELRAAMADDISRSAYITRLTTGPDGATLGLSGDGPRVLVAAFVGMYRDCGAENYVELTLQDPANGERFAVTVQRVEGKTPNQLRREAEAERDTLRARLAAIENAPTLCWQDVHDPSDLYWRRPDPAQVDTRELIARPAKD